MEDRPKRARWFLPGLVVWTALLAVVPPFFERGYSFGTLIGPDPYTRLARVLEWWDSGDGWASSGLGRAGGGRLDLHWTRPVDVLLLAGAAPLATFLDRRAALVLWSHVSNPLAMLLAALVLAWGLRGAWSPGRRRALAFLFVMQPAILSYGLAARIDHHAALLLCACAAIAFTLRIARGDGKPINEAVILGSVLAIGLWISFEFLLVIGVVMVALWSGWILGRRDTRWPAFIAGLAAAWVTSFEILVERGHVSHATWEFDRLSRMHLPFLLALAAISVGLVLGSRFVRGRGVRARLVLFAGVGLVAGAAVLPISDLRTAPFRLVDPLLGPIWYHAVGEIQPLVQDGVWNLGVLADVALAAVAVPVLVRAARRGPDPLWITMAAGVVVFLPLALLQRRSALFAELFLVVPVAGAACGWLREPRGRRRVALAVTALLLVVPPVLTGVPGRRTAESGPRAIDRRARVEMARWMTRTLDVRRSPLVLCSIDLGPVLRFESPFSILAAPYHRNVDAIRDGTTFFRNESHAREVATRRAVRWVLVERAQAESEFEFERRLARGESPAWLVRIPLERAALEGHAVPSDRFELYRVNRDPDDSAGPPLPRRLR